MAVWVRRPHHDNEDKDDTFQAWSTLSGQDWGIVKKIRPPRPSDGPQFGDRVCIPKGKFETWLEESEVNVYKASSSPSNPSTSGTV